MERTRVWLWKLKSGVHPHRKHADVCRNLLPRPTCGKSVQEGLVYTCGHSAETEKALVGAGGIIPDFNDVSNAKILRINLNFLRVSHRVDLWRHHLGKSFHGLCEGAQV